MLMKFGVVNLPAIRKRDTKVRRKIVMIFIHRHDVVELGN